MKTKPDKPYWEMNTAELAEATKQYDQEFVPTRPLTPEMRAAWNRAKRKKPGRPVIGKGAKRVLVSIEGGLLKAVDSHAKKQGLTRSAFIATSLRKALGKIA